MFNVTLCLIVVSHSSTAEITPLTLVFFKPSKSTALAVAKDSSEPWSTRARSTCDCPDSAVTCTNAVVSKVPRPGCRPRDALDDVCATTTNVHFTSLVAVT
ncbi:uncharacterized protein LOC125239828 [Leguminivora glycinivorella]|uniref:uncharacterized protein LOC125234538 n=1 Tax=Leguminivora glycinivorella TaxID=1035111 RepID=UPI00200E08ED|nr:uncharacterized protein LOC125234538 [Leguminivora glycinivorella]XP_048003499.1 uncharacterized protein LOC125239828 [Leguminivora glycinivorella]